METQGSEMVPSKELERRINALQVGMKEQGIEGALLVERADLYYFTGTGQSGHLFVPSQGEPQLLVRKNLRRACQESNLSRVVSFENWEQLSEIMKTLVPEGRKIGLELDLLPVKQYFRYQKRLPSYEFVDVSPIIRQIRAVKTSWELERQFKAAKLSEEAFGYAREILQEGMTEIELAGKVEGFLRSRGHLGPIRMRGFNQELYFGHIMAGANAAKPSYFDGPTGGPGLHPSFPQGAGTGLIRKGEPVLIDFVTVRQGYMVDQTRIFSLGELPSHLQEAYRVAVEIKQDLASRGQAGVPAGDLFGRAWEMAEKAGLSEHFLGYEEKINFVGHGVGLEVDEAPIIARGVEAPLEEGMVFALEPKFTFPEEGVVGIEDTFVVRGDCLEQITSFEEEKIEISV